MYYRPAHASAPRRGVILLVVIALLTLFAVVGIAFVMYAQSRADIARIFRDSQQQILNQGPPDVGQTLLAEFLSQFIFDVYDPIKGGASDTVNNGNYRNSALRGHSLARTMYGYNAGGGNNLAFNGVGRQRSTKNNPLNPYYNAAATNPPPIDEYDLVNYMWWDNQVHDPERPGAWRNGVTAALSPFFGGFNVPYTYPDQQNMFLAATRADGTVLCPSYHRPWITRKYILDANGNGQDFTLNPLNVQGTAPAPTTNAPSPDPKWYDTQNIFLRYMTLRPRPAEMGSQFPPPINGGDVQNLVGGNGGRNDSVWIDIGYPVQTLPDGRRYKPLFAPLIIDLDSRVNLNLHGNVRGSSNSHVSNQGWGPWEVNLKWVLNNPNANPGTYSVSPLDSSSTSTNWTSATEWSNMLVTASGSTSNRYGPDKQPSMTTWLPGVDTSGAKNVAQAFGTTGGGSRYNSVPAFYSMIDYDGYNETGSSTSSPITPPASSSFSPFPTFVPSGGGYGGYGNGVDTGGAPELAQHPLLYSFYHPAKDLTTSPPNYDNSPSGYNLAAALSSPVPSISDQEMFALLYDVSGGSSDTLSNSHTITALSPNNFSDTATKSTNSIYLGNSTLGVRRRMLVTTRSFDVDHPGYLPWVWDRDNTSGNLAANQVYQLAIGGSYPVGQPLNYPTNYTTGYTSPPSSTTGSDFGADWRANETLPNPYSGVTLADGRTITITPGRLDLTRPLLYTFPNPQDPTQKPDAQHPFLSAYPRPDSTLGYYNPDPMKPDQMNDFNVAQADRQQFAADLFVRLMKVTGAPDLTGANAPQPGTPQYDGLRWLAQLAVNIVDYIDSDDIITPFNWNPAYANNVNNGWVYGVELPRVVLNEVYAEIINLPTDTGLLAGNAPSSGYNVNFAIELYNPLTHDGNGLIDSGAARLHQNLTTPTPDPKAISIYQVQIAKSMSTTSASENYPAENVLGDPDFNVTPAAGQLPNTIITATFPAPTANAPLMVNAATKLDSTSPVFDQPSGNTGFFVLGPTPPASVTLPGTLGVLASGLPTPTLSLSALTFSDINKVLTSPDGLTYTVVLRRLACPWLAFDAIKNPYVTVDYMDNVPVNDGVNAVYGKTTNVNLQAVASRVSYGRTQPYVNPPTSVDPTTFKPVGGGTFQIQPAPSGAPTTTTTTTAQTTFFQHNADKASSVGTSTTLLTPFFWLTHLDRRLISPMELLDLSACKPYELTHQFVDKYGVPYQNRAPWFDNTARIYRVLELLETWNRQLDMQPVGIAKQVPPIKRLPGKININTIWDPDVFMALCDPQTSGNGPNTSSFVVASGTTPNTTATTAANVFNANWSVDQTTTTDSSGNSYPSDPSTVFEQLLASRSPSIQSITTKLAGGGTLKTFSHAPGPNDQPFMGLGFGAYQGDPQFTTGGVGGGLTGVNSTLLRPLAVSSSGVTIKTLGTPVTFNTANPLNLISVNSALVTANASMPLTVAVDSGPNEEFVVIPKGAITGGGTPTIGGTAGTGDVKFYKSHAAGFGIGRVLAPILTSGTQPSVSGMTPPYLQHQLLNKIANNVTTRSNVFAVWLTVGFFQVVNDVSDPTLPNQLGTEIGSEQGLNASMRHHMFAIVDRTALCVPDARDLNSKPQGFATTATAIPSGGLQQMNLAPNQTVPLDVQPGSLIMIVDKFNPDGSVATQETVMVLDVLLDAKGNRTSLVVRCNNPHNTTGLALLRTLPGNPGPQVNLDLNSNKELIPVAIVLD